MLKNVEFTFTRVGKANYLDGDDNIKIIQGMVKKLNELIDLANESQKRDKQVREAIAVIVQELGNKWLDKKVNEILNSTKE